MGSHVLIASAKGYEPQASTVVVGSEPVVGAMVYAAR